MILLTSASVSRMLLPEPRQAPNDRALSLIERSDQPMLSANSRGLTVLGMMLIAPVFLGEGGMRRDFSRAGRVATPIQPVNAAGMI